MTWFFDTLQCHDPAGPCHFRVPGNNRFLFIVLLDGCCGAAAPIASPREKVCACGAKESAKPQFAILSICCLKRAEDGLAEDKRKQKVRLPPGILRRKVAKYTNFVKITPCFCEGYII
jgi:hypothetical protein